MVKALALSVQSLLASTSGDLQTARSLAESAGQLAKQDPHLASELVRVALGHAMNVSANEPATLHNGAAVTQKQTKLSTSEHAATHVGYAMPGLTHREWEVAGLVARGQTNRQIAAQLYLSEKTIERYLSKIFSKLNINARASLAAYVTRTALATPTESAPV